MCPTVLLQKEMLLCVCAFMTVTVVDETATIHYFFILIGDELLYNQKNDLFK